MVGRGLAVNSPPRVKMAVADNACVANGAHQAFIGGR